MTEIGPTAAKFPDAGWLAVRVMLPGLSAIRARPFTDAVVGSDEVNDQAAGEVDVGDVKGTTLVAPLSRSMAISLKLPIVVFGVTAETVTFIDVVVDL